MKHQATLMGMAACLACILAPTSHGQITVNEGDLPQGGSAYTFQNVPLEVLVDFSASGPGWVWDFSGLAPTDSTVQDVLDMSQASFATSIVFNAPWDPEHQADHFYTFLALPDLGGLGLPVDIESILGYHQIANGTYTQVGLALTLSGLELPIPFTDVDEVHPVPLTADASLESTSAYSLNVPENLYYAVDQTRESEVDGYGTLLLPDGTSHEVLRLRSTVLSNDTVYVAALGQGLSFERETVTYSWLSDGGMPWLEVSTVMGVPIVVRYQGSAPPASGLSETSSTWSMHPNPASQGQTVRLSDEASAKWSVHASNGKRVASFLGTSMATDELAPGVYLVRNELTGLTSRLVVQ